MPIDTIDTLIRLGMIKNNMRVIDLGCGGGNWAVDLIDRGYKLDYLGLDVQYAWKGKFESSVSDPYYRFFHLNVKCLPYNPLSGIRPTEMMLPLRDNSVDLVICHSLFTHLGELKNATHYLSEIKRVLKVSGYLWITFFKSPPNSTNYGCFRTVYAIKDIHKLLEDFSILEQSGGNTCGMHDQFMIAARL